MDVGSFKSDYILISPYNVTYKARSQLVFANSLYRLLLKSKLEKLED